MASKADLLRVSDCTESWLLAPELPHDMHIFGVSGLTTTRVLLSLFRIHKLQRYLFSQVQLLNHRYMLIRSTSTTDTEHSEYSNPPVRRYRVPEFANMSSSTRKITPAEKAQYIRALRSHQFNTIVELIRVEQAFAKLGTPDCSEPMTSACKSLRLQRTCERRLTALIREILRRIAQLVDRAPRTDEELPIQNFSQAGLMSSSWVHKQGFCECNQSFSFRPLKLSCALISANTFSRDAFEVSLGNASSTAFSLVERTLEMTVCRFSGRRARSATARLPCLGDDRIRAIPVP
ncbi:hypothetical protein IG631_17673 [Alternaria alternata]|nr:hypothetical protein IG631_17673 [Alternaria alternata]